MSLLSAWPETLALLTFAALGGIALVLHRTASKRQKPLLIAAVTLSTVTACLLVFAGHPATRPSSAVHVMFYPAHPANPQTIPLQSASHPSLRLRTRSL